MYHVSHMHFIRSILHNIKYRLILHSILHNFILHFYTNSVYQDKNGPIKYIEHTIKGSPRLHKSSINVHWVLDKHFWGKAVGWRLWTPTLPHTAISSIPLRWRKCEHTMTQGMRRALLLCTFHCHLHCQSSITPDISQFFNWVQKNPNECKTYYFGQFCCSFMPFWVKIFEVS